MQTLLSRKWWVFLIRGLLAIVFGFLALVWPGQTILSLVILFGIYSLIDGFLAVIASIASARFRIGWWAILVEGLVGIVLGVTVLAWPDVTAYAVVVIIGIWALATGLAEFIGAISLRRVISGEFWFILAGILSIILGVLLVAMPKAGAATLLLFIAIYAVIFGVMLTFLSFRLRKLQPGD